MTACYHKAIQWLSYREYSRYSLAAKLSAHSACAECDLPVLLDQLEQEGALSDARFTESVVYSYSQRGQGPLKIEQKLKNAGVKPELIQQGLYESEIDWQALLIQVREKRFGKAWPETYPLRARQMRFLQGRGFPVEMIRQCLNG